MKTGLDSPLSTPNGSVDDRFRLEAPLRDEGNGLRSAKVIDRYTLRAFELWYLPPVLCERLEDVDALEARVTALIPVTDRRILRTYGLHRETAEPYLRMEWSKESALAAGPGANFPGPAQALPWLQQLAGALDATATQHGLAHGAVSPFWIRLTADGVPRLGGYSFASAFVDAGAVREEDAWFLSPQRRSRASPDTADDVYGLAAVAFWALAGGVSADQLPRQEVRPGMIESLRRSRGLPPTGWKAGWDEAIASGLSPTPSLRPATTTALTALLLKLLPEESVRAMAASPVRSAIARRLPPWRDRDRRGGLSSSVGGIGRDLLPAMGDRLADLGLPPGNLDEERRALEAASRENALQRVRLQSDLSAAAQAVGEAEAKRQRYEATARDLEEKLRAVQEKEHAIRAREAAAEAGERALTDRESGVAEQARSLDTQRQELDARENELRRQHATLEQQVRDSAQTQDLLAGRRKELEGIDQELAARRAHLARELAALEQARGNFERDARALKTEQDRLAPRETEIARKESGFEAHEKTLSAREGALAKSAAETATAREKLEAERAELNRLMVENKSIVAEARTAEQRVEAARAERTRIEKDLAARQAQAETRDTELGKREAAAKEQAAKLGLRETETTRRESTFREFGIGLQAATGAADIEKWVAALVAEKGRLDDRTKALVQREAEIEQQKKQLADNARTGEQTLQREKESLAGTRRQVETERAGVEEAKQVQARERAGWEAETKKQQEALALKTAETERAAAELAARSAAKAEEFKKTEDALRQKAAPPPPKPPIVWYAATAMAAVVALILGYLYFRMTSDNASLRREAAASAGKTTLVVVTDPPGAEVTVTGQPAKASPARYDNLPAGPVQVRVAKEGFGAREHTLDVKEGQTTVSETLVLHPLARVRGPTGMVFVRTKPTGAEVRIQGFPPAFAPSLFGDVPVGPTKVSVRLDRYVPVERTVEVKPGEDTMIDITLALAPPPKLTGGVSVTTDPAGAEVVLGSRPAQTSPAVFRDVDPGKMKLVVRREGFDSVEQTIEVKAGETVTVPTIALKAKPVVAKVTPTPTAAAVVLSLPKELTVRAGAVEFRLVRVEAGETSLAAGAGGKVAVKVTRPFLMAQAEVTQAAYEAVMGENPSATKEKRVRGPDEEEEYEVQRFRMESGRQVPYMTKAKRKVPGKEVITPLLDNPVENVTWDQALDFCRRLTQAAAQQRILPSGTTIRLPTEAEWEVAHRGGVDWSSAGGRLALERFAWAGESAGGNHRAVRQGQANAFGLYDLDGNVAEWCIDAWTTSAPTSSSTDPVALDAQQQQRFGKFLSDYTFRAAADANGRRLVRGGSFRTTAEEMMIQPVRIAQLAKAGDIGFRVVVASKLEE